MKFTVASDVLPLHPSISVSPLGNGYTELTYTEADGSLDTTVFAGVELEEAMLHLSQMKKGPIRYWDLVQHQMSVWGRGNYWRFNYPKKKQSMTISRGYVVFLLQEILGCKVDRAKAIAHQAMSPFFGLGSNNTSGARQITRFREHAGMHITQCIKKNMEQGSLRSTKDCLFKVVLANLFQAFQYVEKKFNDSKRHIPSIQQELINKTLSQKSVNWLKSLANKICGHFFNNICPLAESR